MIESRAPTSCRCTFFDRHLMNRGLSLSKPSEQHSCAIAPRRGQRRLVDQCVDLGQAAMRMMRLMGRRADALRWFVLIAKIVVVGMPARVVVLVPVRGVMPPSGLPWSGVLMDDELRCGDTGSKHPRRAHIEARDREAAQGILQLVERQTGVEERAEDHVAGNPGETIEIEDT